MIDPIIYFLLFLKASLFSTGGLSNLPSLRQDLLARGWARESFFGESISIGQLSPGPNGLWVISLGYLTYGIVGALMALIAITMTALPVLLVSAGYARIQRQRWVPGFMRGISLAVVGILLTVVWSIIKQPGVDWRGWCIAGVAALLGATKRVNLFIILLLAGIAGYFIYR